MANKAAMAVVTGLGVVAGTVFLATRAKAAPKEPEIIPTLNDIMASKNMGELEVYYMYMGQLLITGKIDRETYEELYQAYVTRFYQLTGWQQ